MFGLIFRFLAVAYLAVIFVLTGSFEAEAQSNRFLNRSVKAGERIEFQWLNFDEAKCRDRGYPKLIVKKKPKLGRYKTVRRKFTQTKGRCKGRRFSVLLVYYVAGRKKGVDKTTYVVSGASNIVINLRVRVR